MADELTIDQLAQRTGMTVRNIRAHQSRGLLPGPDIRGRTGYYGPEHLERIELIQAMQADGYNLDLIRKLLEEAGGQTDEVVRFAQAVREPFGDERPVTTTLEELQVRFGSFDAALTAPAIRAGLLYPRDDGMIEVSSPRLLDAGQELQQLGVEMEQALDLLNDIRGEADRVSEAFVELFISTVWDPFEAAGRPPERWPEVREALERLRPLAASSLLSIFQVAMKDAVQKAFGEQLERVERDP